MERVCTGVGAASLAVAAATTLYFGVTLVRMRAHGPSVALACAGLRATMWPARVWMWALRRVVPVLCGASVTITRDDDTAICLE
jgi:hypothetical protein